MSVDAKKLSKFLSLVLRHKPEIIGLTLDPAGWARVDDLVARANANGVRFDRDDLTRIISTGGKMRLSVSLDGQFVRASHGHSVLIDLGLTVKEPPEFLFHGTADRFVDSIMLNGLKPQRRRHVHLTADAEAASKIGQRHGKPIVISVQTGKMILDGFEFYRADNGIWLTDQVPPQFLSIQATPTDSARTSKHPKLST